MSGTVLSTLHILTQSTLTLNKIGWITTPHEALRHRRVKNYASNHKIFKLVTHPKTTTSILSDVFHFFPLVSPQYLLNYLQYKINFCKSLYFNFAIFYIYVLYRISAQFSSKSRHCSTAIIWIGVILMNLNL